jgi:endo-1,4-beta-xylanase
MLFRTIIIKFYYIFYKLKKNRKDRKMNNPGIRKCERIAALAMVICFISLATAAAQTICSNATGSNEGYVYELWHDEGSTCITLNSGGAFSCEWSNVGNMLTRKGVRFDRTQTHQEIGDMTVDYGCTYQAEGNVYTGVYGWTTDPLVEYYIIDSWGDSRPPDAESKGTITVDGGVYDIYETTWIADYIGGENHQMYWSVRSEKRTSGTISASQHFDMWESLGMDMWSFYEVSFVVEGFDSGTADVYTMSININGQSTTPYPTPEPTLTPQPEILGDVDSDGTITIVDALLTAQYYVNLDPDNFNPDVADTNCDGVVTIVDALIIAQYYVELITEFC